MKIFFLFSMRCLPLNVPAVTVICVFGGSLTRAFCSRMLHLQYVAVCVGMKVTASENTVLKTHEYNSFPYLLKPHVKISKSPLYMSKTLSIEKDVSKN